MKNFMRNNSLFSKNDRGLFLNTDEDAKKNFEDGFLSRLNNQNFFYDSESFCISIPSFHEFCALKTKTSTKYLIKDPPFYG